MFCFLLNSFFKYIEPAVAVRSSIADARGSISFNFEDDTQTKDKRDSEVEKPTPVRRTSHSMDTTNNINSGNNKVHSKDIDDDDITMQSTTTSTNNDNGKNTITQQPIRKTSFVTLPNTTTWQEQSVSHQKNDLESKFILKFIIFIKTKNDPSKIRRKLKKKLNKLQKRDFLFEKHFF